MYVSCMSTFSCGVCGCCCFYLHYYAPLIIEGWGGGGGYRFLFINSMIRIYFHIMIIMMAFVATISIIVALKRLIYHTSLAATAYI